MYTILMDTIFDKILQNEIPAEIVYEDAHVLAFNDINPQAPVHVLVIPKIRCKNLVELADIEPAAVVGYVKGIAKTIQTLNLSEGYRTVFNAGTHGQQTVDYLHAHILGKRQLNWPPG